MRSFHIGFVLTLVTAFPFLFTVVAFAQMYYLWDYSFMTNSDWRVFWAGSLFPIGFYLFTKE